MSRSSFRRGYGQRYWLPALFCVVILSAAWVAFSDAAAGADQYRYENLIRRIDDAVTTCYAVEGRYPPSFVYLAETYGIRVDESLYAVGYDVWGANIRPIVTLTRVGDAAGDTGEFDE